MKQSEGWISARTPEPSGWRRVVLLMLCIINKPPNTGWKQSSQRCRPARGCGAHPWSDGENLAATGLRLPKLQPLPFLYVKAMGVPLTDCWHMVSFSVFLNWTLYIKSVISASIEIFSEFLKWDEEIIKFQMSVPGCAGISKTRHAVFGLGFNWNRLWQYSIRDLGHTNKTECLKLGDGLLNQKISGVSNTRPHRYRLVTAKRLACHIGAYIIDENSGRFFQWVDVKRGQL